jgi:hypothetical protein
MYKVFDNIVKNIARGRGSYLTKYVNKIIDYNLFYEVCFDLLSTYLNSVLGSYKAETVL